MSNKVYVIRSHQFGYNDECYYVCGSRIDTVYTDKKQAETAYKSLQVKYIRNTQLSDEGSIFDAEAGLIEKLNDFVFEKTGVYLCDKNSDYLEYDASLPTVLSDDEVFEFGKLADISGYQLVAFNEKAIFYALWDTEEQDFLHDYDEGYEGLSYAHTEAKALVGLEDWIYNKDWDSKLKLKGSLEKLSGSPILLQQLIESNKRMSYQVEKSRLVVKKTKVKDLVALNALLSQPLFEVRELTPEAIIELEKNLGYEEY